MNPLKLSPPTQYLISFSRFTQIFDQPTKQEEVFECVVRPVIDKLVRSPLHHTYHISSIVVFKDTMVQCLHMVRLDNSRSSAAQI